MVFTKSIAHDAVGNAIIEVVTVAQAEAREADNDFKPNFGCTFQFFSK